MNNNRVIVVLAALAFLGFLAWQWRSPAHANPQQQQVVVNVPGGCCCGQAQYAGYDWLAATAIGTHAEAAPAVALPAKVSRAYSSGAYPAPRAAANAAPPIARTAGAPVALAAATPDAAFLAYQPLDYGMDLLPIGYVVDDKCTKKHPCDAQRHVPVIAVAEPPAWPLFALGAAGVLLCGFAARRDDKAATPSDH